MKTYKIWGPTQIGPNTVAIQPLFHRVTEEELLSFTNSDALDIKTTGVTIRVGERPEYYDPTAHYQGRWITASDFFVTEELTLFITMNHQSRIELG